LNRKWDDTHSHYFVSGADELDSDDVESAIRTVVEHGLGSANTGSQVLIFGNHNMCQQIASFRAGQPSRPGGPVAKHDFVPSVAQPAFMSQEVIIGQQAPAFYNRVAVEGNYSVAFVISTDLIPDNYILVTASNGPGGILNPVGIRQHPDMAQQGLRLIAGNYNGYPIIDSFSLRTFGVGVRQRAAAAVVQVSSTAKDYEPPSKESFGLSKMTPV
jgi:hypothetical protein